MLSFSVPRGSCGDLVDNPSSGVSPSGSVTSMPSCLPFSWFGERGRERLKREREKLRSVSSSSLPYMTTGGSRDCQVRGEARIRTPGLSSPTTLDFKFHFGSKHLSNSIMYVAYEFCMLISPGAFHFVLYCAVGCV